LHVAQGARRTVIAANLPSQVKKRATDGCLVYKPDYLHVPFQVAELSGGRWDRKADHTMGSGERVCLRWRTVASKVFVLLAHFPWGGKAALTVNGKLQDVVDLYCHAKYTEPLEVFRSDTTAPVELELRIYGQNPLSRAAQIAFFGFLIGREISAEPRRVETDAGFLAIQRQQIVNWLAAIKGRGATLEEVTQQRKGAYTLRISEGMAFMPAGGRVLDMGCGYVFREILRDIILPRGIDYRLQDIDPEVCQSNTFLFAEYGLSADRIFCGDNTNLPYPDCHFQGVFSSHCLEHSRDLGRTFSELRRIISPGGTLVFAVPRNWDRAEEHTYAPLHGGWEAFTERHGFAVISSNLGCYYGEGGEYDLMVVATRN
jgi:SAM-dependent methyltransferase